VSEDGGPLLHRASKALGWSFLNTAASRFGTLAIGIMLARLLGPHEFGAFAVAMVALIVVLSFNELGVSLAIVRWPGDPARIAPTVTTIATASSAFLCIVALVAAPWFAGAMGAPGATGVVRALSLCIVINGLVATPAALLQRGFAQGRRMLIDQVNTWAGALTSIALAVAGMGAMSLAVGRLAGSLASAVLFIKFSPEPLRFGFDRRLARELMKFGLPLAGSSIVVCAVLNVDQLVVGNVLGATALGFYVLAFNLSSWPVAMFSQPVRSVAPAAFARLQHDPPTMRRTFVVSFGLLAAVTLPVCLLLVGTSGPLIDFVYGPAWSPAAKALLWLALLGALRIPYELIYDYFVVLAKPRVVFTVQVVWLGALIPALIVGGKIAGIAGVGAAHVIVGLLVVLPLYLRELRQVEIKTRELAKQIALPLLTAAVTGATALGLSALGVSGIVGLAAAGIVALAAIAVGVAGRSSAIREFVGSTRGAATAEPAAEPLPVAA
jgi:O-antigen/teichoic acid export membrane protein